MTVLFDSVRSKPLKMHGFHTIVLVWHTFST